MIRELLDYVNDILDAVVEIEDFTKDMNFDGSAKDRKTTFFYHHGTTNTTIENLQFKTNNRQ